MGLLPPSQGSENEKLYELYCFPLVWPRRLRRWPSPRGSGRQADLSNRLRVEKLLKLRPTVPITCPAPKPPESSTWSDGFSTTLYSISTVPSAWFRFTGCGCVCCSSKLPKLVIPRVLRMSMVLEYFRPGFV